MSLSISVVANTATDQMFRGLGGMLDKAAAHGEEKGIEETVYLNWRLAPDMFPFFRQVQIATEFPMRTLSRLAGAEIPDLPTEETSLSELKARVAAAQEHIRALPAGALDADPDGSITFPAGPEREMTMPRRLYLQQFVLPNLYFHTTASYMILRHMGVDVGKFDFLAVPRP